jgi:hypothetical protein
MSFNLLSNIWFANAVTLAKHHNRVRPALAPAKKSPQLEQIKSSGIDLFEAVRRIVRRILYRALRDTANTISHNFERNCDTVLTDFFKASGRLEEVSRLDIARFAGFVRGLATSRLAWRAIEPASDRGFNSPHNFGHLLPELWEKFKTPGRAARQIVLVRKRAEAILAPAGLKPCWEDILVSVLSNGQIGKAAVVLAARTKARTVVSSWDCFRKINTYRVAREYLVWTQGLKPLDEAQNVLAIWQGHESRPTETIEVEEFFDCDRSMEASEWFLTAMPSMTMKKKNLTITPAVGLWKRSWYEADSRREEPFPEKGFFIEHPSLGGVFIKDPKTSSAVSAAKDVFDNRNRDRNRQLGSRRISA